MRLLALVFGYDSPRVAAAAPAKQPTTLHRNNIIGGMSEVTPQTQTSNTKELNSIEQVTGI